MINFRELKQHCNIEQVARGYLALDKKIKVDDGGKLIVNCPRCENSQIVITPTAGNDKTGLFFCSNKSTRKKNAGGDLLNLVSHLHDTNVRESAEALAAVYIDSDQEEKEEVSKPQAKPQSSFDPLKYINTLKREQEDVSEFGIIAELCEETGMGLCTKGINRGKLTIPVQMKDGTTVFIGVTGDVSVPKKWRVA